MRILRQGGYVNPVPEDQVPSGVDHNGITLRDYFAAKALQSLLSVHEAIGSSHEFASMSYQYADAMLKARGQQS